MLRSEHCARGWRGACLALVAILLGGCSSAPTTPLSRLTDDRFEAVEAAEDLSEVGVLAILSGGNDAAPVTHWIDDVQFATGHRGFYWLPLLPGDHTLSYGNGGASKALELDVDAGEVIYLRSGLWAGSPYSEIDREEFLRLLEAWKFDRRVELDRQRHAFLPEALRQLVEGCTLESLTTMCSEALETIPSPLIDPEVQSRMLARVEAATQGDVAAAPDSAVDEGDAPSEKPASIALPPEAQRDRLMLAIGDLFAAGQAAEALPYFEQLDGLPVPVDPAFEFYRAQARLAAGDRLGAEIDLARFLEDLERDSRYYAPALRLMTRIEASR